MDDNNNNGTQIAIEKLKHEVADVKSQLKDVEKMLEEGTIEENPEVQKAEKEQEKKEHNQSEQDTV